jgi:hypothetical protein
VGADFKAIDRNWDDLKQLRIGPRGRVAADRRLFHAPQGVHGDGRRPTELIRRRVTSSWGPGSWARRGAAGGLSGRRGAAVHRAQRRPGHGPGRPLARPRRRGPDYLDTLQWAMFDRMMLPQSGFLSSISRVAVELRGFGTGVQWIGRKRGFGPIYQARPLRSCWIAENEDGEVDTLYFRYTLPAWRVLERYPEADQEREAAEPGLGREDLSPGRDPVARGRAARRAAAPGAVATQKPFQAVLLAVDQKRARGKRLRELPLRGAAAERRGGQRLRHRRRPGRRCPTSWPTTGSSR